MERQVGAYVISDDKARLDLDRIGQLLSTSYWAKQRAADVIAQSIANSVCYGIYEGERQVGFARVVTDYATVFYLCDVIIDEAHRGNGLGKQLMACIIEQYGGLHGLLGTLDAHGLYEQYGFRQNERLMNRRGS
ncbi:GNAT superfamily N-acetyltransferase [Paenibacillus phyllosphaerae]|uniref:GNAT superfamily N-acetyltransferase n=1 Tax=Paenibacillus phyllosphaerae TaxID=274593 RepID=A0A7W5FL73_9BACL|nr:GNAT family N-acetyltransferase [Paenibacillus phyllosphaerae]MBB3108778.1 GNAT superfamily N-acetyltransferase [Paenibacillus phyllosphaerae]